MTALINQNWWTLINDLYKHAFSLYANYFCPTLKLKEKQRVNSKYVKKYYPPKTPYQRLLDSEQISREAKLLLSGRRINPLTLLNLKKLLNQNLKSSLIPSGYLTLDASSCTLNLFPLSVTFFYESTRRKNQLSDRGTRNKVLAIAD